MFKKFFILFLACFFVATIKTSATSQADSKYQTVKTVKARKVVNNNTNKRVTKKTRQNRQYAVATGGTTSRTRVKSANKSTNRNLNKNTTRNVNRKRSNSRKINTAKPNTKNKDNFYAVAIAKENAEITSTANIGNTTTNNDSNVVVMTTYDNSYYSPDNVIISMIDKQEEEYKNKQDGKITDLKPIEKNNSEAKKTSFRDRFYIKHNLYVGYGMEMYQGQMLDDLAKVSSEYVNGIDMKKKANPIIFGISEALYFKINNTLHLFAGIDVQVKNGAKMKSSVSYNSHLKTLQVQQDLLDSSATYTYLGADSWARYPLVMVDVKSNPGLFSVDVGEIKNIMNYVKFSDYGSITSKFGFKINVFKRNILSIAPYGIFGLDFLKIESSRSDYVAGEDRIPFQVGSGLYGTNYRIEFNVTQGANESGEGRTVYYGRNLNSSDGALSYDDLKLFFASLPNTITKNNTIQPVYGAGIEFIINNIFTFGFEYRQHQRKMAGLLFQYNDVVDENVIINDDGTQTHEWICGVAAQVFAKKIKIHSLVAKIGIQF